MISSQSFQSSLACSLMLLCVACWMGCGQAPPPQFSRNQVEWLKQETMFLDGEPFAEQTKQEVDQILETLTGNPDHATLALTASDDLELVKASNLDLAAGAVQSDEDGMPQGLFREHCSQCHGITGDGAGPAALLLNPYPRDFRLGKFKFKSTPMRQKPTDEDLRETLIHGIPGTAMPSFALLDEEEINALVDYVKYLSIRGELERYLIASASELPGDSFIDAPSIDSIDQLSPEATRELIDPWIGDQFQGYVLDRWANAQDAISTVPPAPAELVPSHPDHRSLVAAGEKLFRGRGTCYQCHGNDGAGGGETLNYDDWTNDWLKSPGVNPDEKDTYRHFRQAGALRPRLARPRNLALGVYRGGGSDEELYRRIDLGIEGTPMPAATALNEQEKWALVAYVRSLASAKPGTSNSASPDQTQASN